MSKPVIITVRKVEAANAKLLNRTHGVDVHSSRALTFGPHSVRSAPPSPDAFERAGRRAMQSAKK